MNRLVILFVLFISLSSCGGIRNLSDESKRFCKELNMYSISPLKGMDTLNQSPYGNWQLRLSGSPYELGYKKGLLTKSLYQHQEDIFFKQLSQYIPKQRKQRFLLKFLKWYHRDILKDIPLDYKKELFALSRFANEEYNNLGTKYERSLLLHGAHDIGHAMQDLMLVGCSSVALWDNYTSDGKLLIGRNFDFYINEDFSANKIVEFIVPDKGYKYASISWPGMIGVVSGMNEKGLTVTLNAGKSSIPLKGKTPISIVARDILQYAKNIDEAIKIASSFSVFISESILIGSAEDNKAVNIEISPKKFDVFEVNNGRLLCTNHFQSKSYLDDKRNQSAIAKSHSNYRLDKLKEVTSAKKVYAVKDVLQILRDAHGIDGKDIGLGNEKALNQLLAHHAVIFQPAKGIMYVSNNPYQLGVFEAYNLNEIFDKESVLKSVSSLNLEADTLLKSEVLEKYLTYKKMIPEVQEAIRSKEQLSEIQLQNFESSNPELWITYKLLGEYYDSQRDWVKAISYYEIALSKEISSENSRHEIEKKLKKVRKK